MLVMFFFQSFSDWMLSKQHEIGFKSLISEFSIKALLIYNKPQMKLKILWIDKVDNWFIDRTLEMLSDGLTYWDKHVTGTLNIACVHSQ